MNLQASLRSALAFATLLVSLGACQEPVTGNQTFSLYDPPNFLENVVYTENTGTPTEQINRFVADNGLDTVMNNRGLVYSVLAEGDASTRPAADSVITAWFRGYTVDGVEFEASRARPLQAELNNLIEAWRQALPAIGQGGRILILARPSLAYGQAPPSNGGQVLVYEVELLEPR